MSDEYIRRNDAIRLAEQGQVQGFPWQFQMLVGLPPVDVAPVRHGKWKKIGAWGRVYRCNKCGNFLDFDGVNAGRGDANFCPNCGARMDGKKEG